MACYGHPQNAPGGRGKRGGARSSAGGESERGAGVLHAVWRGDTSDEPGAVGGRGGRGGRRWCKMVPKKEEFHGNFMGF